jgi:hypothetical protein
MNYKRIPKKKLEKALEVPTKALEKALIKAPNQK